MNETSRMKHIGWWVVGDEDSKFGVKQIGDLFEQLGRDPAYWNNRGYELIPVFCWEEHANTWEEETA